VLKRLLWALAAVAATLFAVQGGEYGTTDLVRQRARKRALLSEIDTLTRQVDSLSRLKKRLTTDPVLQERIAREEYGMVRGEKELLYWMSDPRAAGDSAAATPGARRGRPGG
jgi:cell division protein FtsB